MGNLVTQTVADFREVADVLIHTVGKHAFAKAARLFHKLLGFAYINKASCDDVRPGNYRAGLFFNRARDDDNAVLRQAGTVTQHHRADVADADTVNKDFARRDFAGNTDFILCDFDFLAVVGN